MTIDQEKIDALLDGALDPVESTGLEAEIAADPSALQALGESTLLNITLKRVINGSLGEMAPMPDLASELASELNAKPGLPSSPANDNSAGWRQAMTAIAASVMVVIAGSAGYWGGLDSAPAPARMEAALGSVQLAQAETLTRALEQLKSGEMANWTNASTGWSGEVTPLRTFKSKDKRWCREYRVSDQMGTRQNVRLGVACRVGDGKWQTELERIAES